MNSMSIEAAILGRETRREYLNFPLSLQKLSMLLFAAQGFRGNESKLVTPSAHEQYPLSIYVVAENVESVGTGLYKYHNKEHSLAEIKKGKFASVLERTALGDQPWVGNAAAIVVLAGDIQSMNHHFSEQPPIGTRGERYSYIEVGAASQNIQLQGTALGVGMVLVGGFNNGAVQEALDLPLNIEPCALICMGNV
jgi:SagB-type dehydrogenase family enzyme